MDNFYFKPEEPQKPYHLNVDCDLSDPRENWYQEFSFGTSDSFSIQKLIAAAPKNLNLSSLTFEIYTTSTPYSDYDNGIGLLVQGSVDGASQEDIDKYEEAYKKAKEHAENQYQMMMEKYHADMKKYKINLANYNKWLAECDKKKADAKLIQAEAELQRIIKDA